MIETSEYKNPHFIIIDVTPIIKMENKKYSIFKIISIKELIELITRENSLITLTQHPMYDLSELLTCDFEYATRFSSITESDICFFNELIEYLLIEISGKVKRFLFYQDKVDEDYVFRKWIDSNSLLLEKYDTSLFANNRIGQK